MNWLRKQSTTNESSPSFEWRALRILAYISGLVFASWMGALLYTASLDNFRDDFWLPNFEYPLWTMLGFHALYYLHILARRIHVSLLAFVVSVILWGNAVTWSWVYMGTEFGLSVALGGAVYIGYALAWSGSLIRMFSATSFISRSSLVTLALATPLAASGLAFGCWWWWIIRSDGYCKLTLPATGIATIVVSVAILATAAVVAWRARKIAHRILKPKSV